MWEILTLIAVAGLVFLFNRKNKLKDMHGTTKIPPVIIKKEKAEDDPEKSIEKLLSDAHSLYEQESYREAEKMAIEILKRDHKNSSAYFILGNIFFEDKNYEDAINSFKKSIEYDPEKDLTLNNLGLVYFKTKDYENAISCFEKSTAINPDNPSHFVNLALAAQKNSNYKLAVKALEKVTALEHTPEKKHLKMLAEAYEKNGEIEKSLKVLAHILEIDPDDVEVKRSLARY